MELGMKNFGCVVNFFCCKNNDELNDELIENNIENPKISLPTPASGIVVFGRYPNGENIKKYMVITVPTTLVSQNGQYYGVIKDPANKYWSDSYQAYIVPPFQTYIEAPVQAALYSETAAITIGPMGNCDAFAVNQTAKYIHGPYHCDFFYNPQPFTNGSYGNNVQGLVMRK
jgi:hypothetical protein